MKKFIALSLVVSVSLFGGGLDDFVEGALNVNTNRPGYYQSQTRGVFSLGDLRARTNTSPNIRNPIRLEAPRLAMGCSGVDIGLGGFSFVADADQLVEKLQAMSGAAAGYAFKMALSTLCKDCDAILSELEKFADMINGLNFNGCQAMEGVGTAFGEAINLNLEAGHDNAFNRGVSEAKDSLVATRTNWEISLANYMGGDVTRAKQAVKDITMQGSFIKRAIDEYNPTVNFGTAGGENLFEGIMRAMLGDIVGYTSTQPNSSKEGGAQTGNFKYVYVPPIYTAEEFKNYLEGGKITYISVISQADDKGEPTVNQKEIAFDGIIEYFKTNINSIYMHMIAKNPLSVVEKEFLASLPIPIYKYLNTLVLDGGGKKDDISTFLAIIETQAFFEIVFKDITYTVFAFVSGKSTPIDKQLMKDFHKEAGERIAYYNTVLNEFLQTEGEKLQSQTTINNYYQDNYRNLKRHMGSSNLFGNYLFSKGL